MLTAHPTLAAADTPGRDRTLPLSPSPPLTAPLLGKRRNHDFAAPQWVNSCDRLPAKTQLYCCVPRNNNARAEVEGGAAAADTAAGDASGDDDGLPPQLQPGELLTLAMPSAMAGRRICEYLLQQPAQLARCAEAPDDDALVRQGCAGWRSADGNSVRLLAPAELLRLVDDDKQAGLAQAFLTDLFARASLRQQ